MTLRVKFLCVSLLLCLALAGTFLSAAGTIQAYQQFQKSHQHILRGDVNTVSSWMTLPYIAQVYHVPQNCLTQALHISNPWLIHHATLHGIADYTRRPLNTVLLNVQNAILTYRKKHTACPAPAPPGTKTTASIFPLLPSALWRGECL